MEHSKIIAIVQARMSSSRLPGKVLLPLAGMSVIEGILHRVKKSSRIDQVILATSIEKSDDQLVETVSKAGFDVYRGSLSNVLERFFDASEQFPAEHYVRITGDCPFIDSLLVDELIDHYLQLQADYASNAIEPSLPDGFDCEIFSHETLQRVNELAVEPVDREHVTHYIYTHPELFNIYSHTYESDLSEYRVTLDTTEDYQMIKKICEHLSCTYLGSELADIVTVLHSFPELLVINNMHKRNEGLHSG